MKLHTISRRLTAVALAGVAAATMSAGAAQSASASTTTGAQTANAEGCILLVGCDLVDKVGDFVDEAVDVAKDVGNVFDTHKAGGDVLGPYPPPPVPMILVPASWHPPKPVKVTGHAAPKPVKITGHATGGVQTPPAALDCAK